ncbi:MAG: hypothetical protein C0469_08880 [Cyanobacteria bacterium DS2.3.42]|nr:hypothetical protein [Cyanobacteria bacterium DS2.3.42]
MFTDDFGKYRKTPDRVQLSSEIGAYRKTSYGLTRFSDDIAPFRGKSLSAFAWVSMFALAFGVTGVVLFLLFFTGTIH